VDDGRAGGEPRRAQEVSGEDKKGSVVVKFSPEARCCDAGTRREGNPPDALTDPNAVITDAGNGDIYVPRAIRMSKIRISSGAFRCSTTVTKFLRSSARTGTGPGAFRTPHAMHSIRKPADRRDRHNHRIQILTKDGTYLGEYGNSAVPAGWRSTATTRFMCDSESSPQRHPGWLKAFASEA